MLAADVLDVKIVDDQYKLDWAPDVTPEARCGSSLVVPCRSESLAEEVIGETSGQGKSIGAADNGEIHPAVICYGRIRR